MNDEQKQIIKQVRMIAALLVAMDNMEQAGNYPDGVKRRATKIRRALDDQLETALVVFDRLAHVQDVNDIPF